MSAGANRERGGMPAWVTGEDPFNTRTPRIASEVAGPVKTRHLERQPRDPSREALKRLSRYLSGGDRVIFALGETPTVETGIVTGSRKDNDTTATESTPTVNYRYKGVLQRAKENPGLVAAAGVTLLSLGEILTLSGCDSSNQEPGSTRESVGLVTTEAETPSSTQDFIDSTPESDRGRIEVELRTYLNEYQVETIDSVLASGNVSDEVKQGWTNYLNLLINEQIDEDTKERAADLMFATFGYSGEEDDVFDATRIVPEVWGQVEADDPDIGRQQVVFRVNGMSQPDEDTGKVVMLVGSKEERQQAMGTTAMFREEAMRVLTPQNGGTMIRAAIVEREANGEIVYEYTGIAELGPNGEVLARTDASGENYIVPYTGEKVLLQEGQDTVFYTQQSLSGEEEEEIYFDGQPLPDLEEGQRYTYDQEANQLQVVQETIEPAPTQEQPTAVPTLEPTPEPTVDPVERFLNEKQLDVGNNGVEIADNPVGPDMVLLTSEYWMDQLDGNKLTIEKGSEGDENLQDAYYVTMAMVNLRQQGIYNYSEQQLREEAQRIENVVETEGEIRGINYTDPTGYQFELTGQDMIVEFQDFNPNNYPWPIVQSRGDRSRGFTFRLAPHQDSVRLTIYTSSWDLQDTFYAPGDIAGVEHGWLVTEEQGKQLTVNNFITGRLLTSLQLIGGRDLSQVNSVLPAYFELPDSKVLVDLLQPTRDEYYLPTQELVAARRRAIESGDEEAIRQLYMSPAGEHPFSVQTLVTNYIEDPLISTAPKND